LKDHLEATAARVKGGGTRKFTVSFDQTLKSFEALVALVKIKGADAGCGPRGDSDASVLMF
jgi:hypothetical protein